MSLLQKNTDAMNGDWKAAEYVPDPYGPDAPVPTRWTPTHVARRLIEAFRVDRRMPRIERPKSPGSAHPAMEYSREEMEIWETVPLDPSRFIPTHPEIDLMETAFAWLQIINRTDFDGLVALRIWAIRMSSGATRRGSGTSVRAIACKLGVSHIKLLRRKDCALSAIASELNAKKMPVW